jgi:GDP-L-fucose synthase
LKKDSRIFVAGANGMVGRAIVRELERQGFEQVIAPGRSQLDLSVESRVREFFLRERPEYVFDAAARVGGILENSKFPADFLYENLVIQNNVIRAALDYGASKLLFLGSTCIYPRMAPQPLREEYLLSGALEETNQWYAIAKIAGIKLCEAFRLQFGANFISAMPTNLYGPHDNFDLQSSHVLPALIRKFHEAKMCGAEQVTVWGTGAPRREFLHVDDCAKACVFLMREYNEAGHINVGTGEDLSIAAIAEIVAAVVGFAGEIVFDPSKPDGTPRKLVDISKLRARGWAPQISLEAGLASTYNWYCDALNNGSSTRH